LYRFPFPAVIAVVFAGLLAGVVARAQTVSVVAGDGQLICLTCASYSFQALQVQVTGSNGSPLANQVITWSTNAFSSQASLQYASTVTDSNGLSSNKLIPAAQSQLGYQQYSVTAAAGSSVAAFTLTQGFNFNGIQPAVVRFLNQPTSGLTGAAGSAATSVAQILVLDWSGRPIPNVGLFLGNVGGVSGPTVTCKEATRAYTGVVLTDTTGMATCTPVFGPIPGSGQFQVLVGGAFPDADVTQTPTSYAATTNISFTTQAATPGSIAISQGNGQTVNPGQNLPVALGVIIKDASGAPLAGQGVTWSVSSSTAASLFNTATTTNSSGIATTGVAVLGSAPIGSFTVTAKSTVDSTKSVTFTVTVVPAVSITGLTIVSGNNQSAPVNAAFTSPLVVQVSVSSGSAANIPVQFHVASGSVALSATTVTTDANGMAQVTATAGTVTGAASVTASITSNTGVGQQTFSLNVLPPAPAISTSNFVNGADSSLATLSPCSIGALVAAPSVLGVSGPVPTFPGVPVSTSIRILLNNISAPILSVGTLASGQGQIQFQVPCEVAPGSVPVSVNLGGGTTNLTLTVQTVSPGVYTTPMSDGIARAVLVRPDGSFVSLANPARRGETEVAYVTGLGTTSPAVGTSSVPAPSSMATVAGTVIAGMSGQGVPVSYARLSEDLPGVYVVAFQIPSDMTTGNNVTFSVGVVPVGGGAVVNSNAVKIPVQ
jgi:uncharacterized protein (TIGR03437 family)